MGMDETGIWLSYSEAAKRVKSTKHTIQLWRKAGMPMEWAVDEIGQRYRVVDEQTLLAWWRQKMKNSPVHFYKLRREAIERGETPPEVPEKFRRTRAQRAPIADLTASDASLVPDSHDGDIERPDPYAALLASLPEFVGQREHAALIQAMEDQPPACDGLEVFTRDRFDDPEEVEMMRGICRQCPLLELCVAFAAAGKPSGGMWAGMTPAEVRQIPDGFRAELAPSAA